MSVVTWVLAGGLVSYAASHYTTNTRNEAIAFNAAVGMLGLLLTTEVAISSRANLAPT